MIPTLLKAAPLNAPTLHRLPNGLTIVAERMPIEAVNLSLWINVGSAVESDAIGGMAHFLEHMVFKGTDKLASGQFERLVEERGAVTNAATSHDYTHFYITAAPKDFAFLAPLQMEVVLNPSIPDAAFERERSVVLEEIRRSDDNPRRRIYQRASEMAFERLPYRRSVLGSNSVISLLKAQQMRDFHATWYQPRAITAVAVGNLPVEELIEIVAEGFNRSRGDSYTASFQSVATESSVLTQNLDNGNRVSTTQDGINRVSTTQDGINCVSTTQDGINRVSTFKTQNFNEEPPFKEIKRQEFIDESLQQARLVMIWRVPGLTALPQTYALDVLAAILGNGRTSRLVRDLRENRRLVSHISATNMNYQMQGTFYISAHLPVENLAEVEAAIVQHIRELQNQFVTEVEIARVRTQVANRFVFANETPSDRAGMYGYYQSMVGDLAPALNYPARIQALDEVDLQTAANRYLSPDAYGVIAIKPGV